MNATNTNKSTQRFVQFFGMIGALTAIGHGIFEIGQGNTSTSDILDRIGAYTLLPNYLITGICTIIISLGIIGWLWLYVHKPYGPIVFLVLIVVLFFVGGGVAPIFGLVITCIVSTQIRNQLAWWKALNSPNSLKLFAKIYNLLLTTGTISLLLGICVWLFLTPPGRLHKIDMIDYICWTLLGFGTVLILLSIFAGFSHDVENQ